jgi:hypothetical protein
VIILRFPPKPHGEERGFARLEPSGNTNSSFKTAQGTKMIRFSSWPGFVPAIHVFLA